MTGEVSTFGLRRGTLLCLSGGGYRGAIFHLGALTRLNELGLLAGAETICGVGGSSILGALLATRAPWPLHGAFRAWPEEIAEPLREIARHRPRGRGLLVRPLASPSAAPAALEERYARELADLAADEERELPRVVFGAAGLQLGRMASRATDEREPDVRWELDEPEAGGGLTPLSERERARLENEGYRLADTALREGALSVPTIEPLPPDPPHPRWTCEGTSGGRRGRRPFIPRRREAGGGPVDVVGAEELLERHRPFVQHDSLECYRPDSVATIAEMEIGPRCNTLHRADGELIASVLPASGAGKLRLDYLDGATYADGRPVRSGDYLDEAGGSHGRDACAMRRREGHGNVVYGRACQSGGGLWLQYWFFYYYNDKGFLNVGRHEGDWEMVQLLLGEGGEPEEVTFGRHRGGERASWGQVERAGGGVEVPVIYPARGSHASLPRPGTYSAPGAPDHNDGQGPRSRPRLVTIGAAPLGWVRWPGRWGATRRREAFEGDSPRGPARWRRWADPAGFHAEARPLDQASRWEAPAPPAASFEARLEGNQALLSYSFEAPSTGPAAPAQIVAAALGEGEHDEAIAHSFGIDGLAGTCAMPAPLDSPLTAIRACVSSELGTPGRTETVPVG